MAVAAAEAVALVVVGHHLLRRQHVSEFCTGLGVFLCFYIFNFWLMCFDVLIVFSN
jgi:hypothetical protein